MRLLARTIDAGLACRMVAGRTRSRSRKALIVAVLCVSALSLLLNLLGVNFLLPSQSSAYFDSLAPSAPLTLLATFPNLGEPVYGTLPPLTLLAAQLPVLLPALADGRVQLDRASHTARIDDQRTAGRLIFISRLFSALLGALSIALLLLAANRLFGLRAAIIGAGLCALCPMQVYFSHTAGVTPQTTLWLSAALFVAAGDALRPTLRRAALLGLFVGLAAATKEYAAACGAGWGALMLYQALRRRNAALGRLAAYCGAALAIYLAANLAFLDLGPLNAHLRYYISGGSAEAGSGSFFWKAGNPLSNLLPIAALSVAVLFEVNLLGGAAALWGAVWGARDRRALAALLAPVLGLFLLIQVPFGQILYQYVLPLNLIGLLLFGAVADRWLKSETSLRRTLINVLLVLCALGMAAQVAMLEADLATDGRRPMQRWLLDHLGPQAVVWSYSPSEVLPFDQPRLKVKPEAQQRSGAELTRSAQPPQALIVDNALAWQTLYQRAAFPHWPRFLARLAAGRLGYVPAQSFSGWRERSGNFFGIGQRYVVFVPRDSGLPRESEARLDVAAISRSIFWRRYEWAWAKPLDAGSEMPWTVIDALPSGRTLAAWVLGENLWALKDAGGGWCALYRLPLENEIVEIVAAWRGESPAGLINAPAYYRGEWLQFGARPTF
ncbi:MAG: glycosyltransferase family 39 protein [Candidatus Alcyoniella australis]|nr:glycosyltransferase family 39 protein [Candidatus Alcyoniella australis]